MSLSMKEYKTNRKTLKIKIRETRAKLHQLEDELEQERMSMQHTKVEQLEKYMDRSSPRFRHIRLLMTSIAEDIKTWFCNLLLWIKGKGRD
ncbi:MAG: hypothetical protein OXC07_02810 [Kistimonas sp.]|nr:hypothetical protein [Kistimonas sp.]